MGHRNPQGLVWQKDPTSGYSTVVSTTGGKLFSSEHGPRTDDELNILESGKNYGWPNIAGYLDNVNYSYINWSTASAANCSSTSYDENAIPPGATVLPESARCQF
jgi:glucose/arabinose dehydrogenase